MQKWIPTNRQNIFTKSILWGTGVNFILNFIFIFYYKAEGVAFASVIDEATVAIIQLIYVGSFLFDATEKFYTLFWGWISDADYIKTNNKGLSPSIINTTLVIAGGEWYTF